MKKNSLIITCFILGVLMFIIGGCSIYNKVEIKTTITPKLTRAVDVIAVEYMLGDLLILDEWKNLNFAQIVFLTDRDKPLKVDLLIDASDFDRFSVKFYYTVANITIDTTPVKWDILSDYIETIQNVRWIKKEGRLMENNITPELTIKESKPPIVNKEATSPNKKI